MASDWKNLGLATGVGGIAGGTLAAGKKLFGGGKSPRIDTAALANILTSGLEREKAQVEAGYNQLPQLTQQYEQRQGELGQGIEESTARRAQEFARNLQNVESPELIAQRQAKARELAFRNVPQAQQALRESLAATGGLGRGVAVRALQQPVLQASQQAADQGFAIEDAAAQRDVQRREMALQNIFNSEQGAALQRLGIDLDTARTLLDTGRGDVLERAFRLAGIEQRRTQGLLDIEQQRQVSNIAAEQADQARRGGLFGSLGSIGGGILGSIYGGPMGGALGSSIGGSIGGQLGGGSQPTDFSSLPLLLALQQRRGGVTSPVASKAGVEELRQRVPWPTSSPTSGF